MILQCNNHLSCSSRNTFGQPCWSRCRSRYYIRGCTLPTQRYSCWSHWSHWTLVRPVDTTTFIVVLKELIPVHKERKINLSWWRTKNGSKWCIKHDPHFLHRGKVFCQSKGNKSIFFFFKSPVLGTGGGEKAKRSGKNTIWIKGQDSKPRS